MIGLSKAVRDAEFSAFVVRDQRSLTKTAWLLTGNAEAAAELVQAALVKTYVAWPRVRTAEALAYTRRVLINTSIKTWRATRREMPAEDVPEVAVPDDYRRFEDGDQATRLLATLPARQRTVIVLRYFEDLPEKVVADYLNISVGAVKSAASRGLATLRATLPHLTSEGRQS